jgi:cytochrome c553
VDQFNASHHVKAAQFVDDDSDLVLSQSVEGFKGTFDVFSENNSPVAVSGCFQCHGTTVKVLSSGKLDPATYPNNGIGRINPDGSKGSCSACHGRHQFSVAQARRPDNCGKCHLGPDHPHMEIYEESSHGIMFNAFEDQMKLESDEWIPGKTYSSAPTCHMGATATQKVTHDVSARVSWNLRATVSSKNTDSATKRTNMQNVCQSCHSTTFVSNFYSQLDAGVTLYNEKYAKPAKAIDDMLHSGTLDGTTTGITPILDSRKFNDEEEWAFWELWHHEGRRARAGMAMGGPDYTQWHGFYDTAKTLYRWFVPEACVAVNGTKGMGAADNNVKTQAQKIKDKINYYMGSSDFIYNNNDYMGIRCN